MSFNEQRRHERVTVDIYVHWGWTQECSYTDRVFSISVGGCFLRMGRPAETGQTLFIRLWLPEEKTLRGEVRYRLERIGVGVEFKGLTQADAAALEELAEHYRTLGRQ
jgi:hypothetical protein